MPDNFGIKLGIDGEKAFKQALREINQDFKELGSEMKLATSQFDKNDRSVEALAARNEVLNKSIDAQKNKIDTLRQALKNAEESFGENDTRTKKWRTELNNAEAELNDMERELKQNTGELDKNTKAAKESTSAWEGFGKTMKAVGVAAATAIAAASAAAVELSKAVVSAYGDYEQLVGGVETLFGDSAKEVEKYAETAYKTAGLSANEYMQTVTGFSASLIQSLGGDTAKAAQYADMAIKDMSDNANKMGTDMSSIQSAYQGFAKQNYTMLDNLKLGYGGTKTEMERLLKDAEAISGVHFDISSYADVVQAINVIQTNMGITGTTAKEAEKTISGSMNSMKSAFKNLLTGLGNTNADVGSLANEMVSSFKTVVSNIIPVIESISANLDEVVDAVLSSIEDYLPQLLPVAMRLLESVLNSLIKALPKVISTVMSLLKGAAKTISDNIDMILSAVSEILKIAIEEIGSSLPDVLAAVFDILVSVGNSLISNLPMLLESLMRVISSLISRIADSLPSLIRTVSDLVVSLIRQVPSIIKILVDNLDTIISSLLDGILGAVPQLILAVIQVAVELVKATPQIIAELIKMVPQIIKGIVDALLDPENIWELIKAGGEIIVALGEGIWEGLKALGESILAFFRGIWDSIKSIFSSIWEGITGLFSGSSGGIDDVIAQLEKDRGIKLSSSAVTDIKKIWSSGGGAVGNIADTMSKINVYIDNYVANDSSDIEQLAERIMSAAERQALRMGAMYY